MEWKYFFAISAYILTVSDPVLGATTIIDVMLVDGQSPNEGRAVYNRSGASTLESVCGAWLGNEEALVICRQLGYPGVNKIFKTWPFGTGSSLPQHKLECVGDEESLSACNVLGNSGCTNHGGVICYELGYEGCFPGAIGSLQTPCENGVQDLTIPKCVSLCHNISDTKTYAGLYQGNMCFCGSASTTVSLMDKVDDMMCSSSCVGRDIEKCGGASHIALFDITLYLQNTNQTASPAGCAEPTTTQTEGDETTTVSIQSSLTSSSPPSSSSSSQSSPSPSSPPPASPSVPSTVSTTMEGSTTAPTMTGGMPSLENVQTDLTSPVMTSDVTPSSRTPTGMPGRTTRERITQTGVQSNLGLYIGVGVGGGILLLIVIILLVVFIIRRRRSKDKSSSSDHTILELRLRPEGSDLGVYSTLPFSPNNYSLENRETNMAADDLTTGTGVEESDYAIIAETDMNSVKSARNGSAYDDVPRQESTSGSRRPPQPAPRKSAKDTQFTMHPVTSELYTTPDESQLSNGHRDSIPEYAVSQKFRKEPISQAIPQAPPSTLGPEDINGLYTMPDKSTKMAKAKKLLDSDMDSAAGIDNALYICRGEDDPQVGETPNEYATDKDGVEAGGGDGSDGDTGMVENDLYDTSDRPTDGDTGMVENDLYETSDRPTGSDTGMVENDLYETSHRST